MTVDPMSDPAHRHPRYLYRSQVEAFLARTDLSFASRSEPVPEDPPWTRTPVRPFPRSAVKSRREVGPGMWLESELA